jgi:hypothetical protein
MTVIDLVPRIAKAVGSKGERHKPSYRYVLPSDAQCLPTLN